MSKPEYELIMTIVNRGYSDEVMRAARDAGATGGTVIYARGTGNQDIETQYGVLIHPEKELVMILAPGGKKRAIMEAVCRRAGLDRAGSGMTFALPVDDVVGMKDNEAVST